MKNLCIIAAWLLGGVSGLAQSSFVPGTPEDEAAIRLVLSSDANRYSKAMAPDMDWENAFGIRYTDTKKRDAFYHTKVDPLQAASIQTLLEVRISFIADDLALADVYNHRVGQVDQATGKPGADRWTRSTDIFKKQSGRWMMIAHRVADLRLPWYKHYNQLPTSIPVPKEILASYAGRYQFSLKPFLQEVVVAEDHLVIRSEEGSRILIPTSATEFLSFDPNDLAEYLVVTFGTDSAQNVTLSLAEPWDKTFVIATRVK